MVLKPGTTLFVYGFEGDPPVGERLAPDALAGVLDDGGWSYVVLTREASPDEFSRAPRYHATLAYEDWLDGDIRSPVEVDDGLVIVPPWCEAPSRSSPEAVLSIEPSLVFGTGAHRTTRRCLALITELAASPAGVKTILDLGCGTGVLSLAALKRGGGHAWGCDISALAVEVARDNARRNGLEQRACFLHLPAADLVRPADLVLANLPPAALTELLGHPALHQPGWVIVSGMLGGHLRRLQQELPDHVEVSARWVDGLWHTALLRRHGGDSRSQSPRLEPGNSTGQC